MCISATLLLRQVGRSVRVQPELRRHAGRYRQGVHASSAASQNRSSSTQSAPAQPVSCYYADWAEVVLPEGHRFPMHKYRTCRLQLDADPSLQGLIDLRPSPLALVDDIETVHCPQYIRRFKDGLLSEEEQRVIGFLWSESHVQRSFASTGGTVAAMHDVMTGRHRAAMQLAGGTHHAFFDRGEGFCVFNDLAVASGVAIRDYGAAAWPILVVDLDVHQGNGTAAIFENDPRVVTFSMHGERNYPWKSKMRSTHDVDLPDDTGDEEYLEILAQWLPRLFDEYKPKLVMYQAGVDALKGDVMGRLGMTRAGLLKRNNAVYSACLDRSLPLVITMGGGYSRPSDASVDAHADVFRSAAYRFAARVSR